MNAREIRNGIMLMGVQDWSRRLFDALIPLPDGTSYNSYLIPGSEKTALIDTVDPQLLPTLIAQLKHVPKIDYIISLHAEQDHSGSIPMVMELYPEATVICSPKAKALLMDHLNIPQGKLRTVEDGETLSLGNRTLRFVHTPWVHWPETMSAYLAEDKIPLQLRFFWLSPGQHHDVCRQRPRRPGSRQTLLRRDYDALPADDQIKHAQSAPT